MAGGNRTSENRSAYDAAADADKVRLVDAAGADATGPTAALIGALTETAPATDTASSGLNGRLQRIAQRITSLIALLPASLGAKTSAASLSVAPASDAIFAVGNPIGVTYTDASISSAAGTSETVAAAGASRRKLIISNPAATSWWINPSGGTAAANGAGSFELAAGAMWTPSPPPTNAVTGIGTAATKLTVVTG